MKNFKKVLFGVLAMLVMVTGVHAADYDYKGSDPDKIEACITQSDKATTRCEVTDNVTITSKDLTIASDVTLVIANGKTLTLSHTPLVAAYDADNSKGYTLTITGGTITTPDNANKLIGVEAGAKLVINNTNLSVTGTTTKLMDVAGASAAALYASQEYTTISINGGVIKSTTKGIEVDAGFAKIDLNTDMTVANDLVVASGSSTGKNVLVNIAGGTYKTTGTVLANIQNAEWTIANGVFRAEASGAKIFGTTASKAGKLTINGGEFTADREVLEMVASSNSEVAVTAGDLTSKNYYVFNIDTGNTAKISGGNFVTENNTSVLAPVSAATSAIKITGGTYIGGNDTEREIDKYVDRTENENLHAVSVEDVKDEPVVYIGERFELKIESPESEDLVSYESPQKLLGGHTYKLTGEEFKKFLTVAQKEGYVATYTLVVNGTETVLTGDELTMPNSNAKLVIKFVAESEQNPENQGGTVDPGTTGSDTDSKDETTDKNPGTFDGIASFVTLAVSSLGAAGYSIKKVIKR